ncbi:hypothetical protein [Streptomyces sp. NPDC021212]|uniref:hypothetical protein n=1 Tax=Streptomyces sp. NPDC021212 TaxID=3365118 RepID=UPI0037A77741
MRTTAPTGAAPRIMAVAFAAIAALLLSLPSLAPPARAAAAEIPAAAGLHVAGGKLVEGNGSPFVMRGVNHAHTWYATRTTQALSDIKALGANTVRVVLSTGDRWTKNDTADVTNVVAQCKRNRIPWS